MQMKATREKRSPKTMNYKTRVTVLDLKTVAGKPPYFKKGPKRLDDLSDGRTPRKKQLYPSHFSIAVDHRQSSPKRNDTPRLVHRTNFIELSGGLIPRAVSDR